jgi:hypothetical protein
VKISTLFGCLCCVGFINLIVVVAGDRRCRLALSIGLQVPPEDEDRIQSPKRCVLNKIQDDG